MRTRSRYIHPDHDKRNPLYSDVHYGQGGIAGGKFTHGTTDTLSLSEANYVASDYISGQGGYILGDM